MESLEEQAMVGQLMRDGLKSRARRVLREALRRISAQVPRPDPQAILSRAVAAAVPIPETRIRYVDGQAIRGPVVAKGVRVILKWARRRKGRVTASSLAEVILTYATPPPDPDRPRAMSALRRA